MKVKYDSLIAGAAVMIPTMATGWNTWKNHYQGIRGKLFLRKIRISHAMLAISTLLVIYQAVVPIEFLDVLHNIFHALHFIGLTLLLLGALAEGYYGGQLNHR